MKKIESLKKIIEFKEYQIEQMLQEMKELQNGIERTELKRQSIEEQIASMETLKCENIASLHTQRLFLQELKEELHKTQKRLDVLQKDLEDKKTQLLHKKNRKKALEKLKGNYEEQIKRKEMKDENTLIDTIVARASSWR